jgi:hypothetical protein
MSTPSCECMRPFPGRAGIEVHESRLIRRPDAQASSRSRSSSRSRLRPSCPGGRAAAGQVPGQGVADGLGQRPEPEPGRERAGHVHVVGPSQPGAATHSGTPIHGSTPAASSRAAGTHCSTASRLPVPATHSPSNRPNGMGSPVTLNTPRRHRRAPSMIHPGRPRPGARRGRRRPRPWRRTRTGPPRRPAPAPSGGRPRGRRRPRLPPRPSGGWTGRSGHPFGRR